MSEPRPFESKPNNSEPSASPDPSPGLPEIKPTELIPDTIDDDDQEEWKPRGPTNHTVAGKPVKQTGGVRR
ncbi:uncharacterized protein B0H18DRAFT_999464 [Fomitopsis serialis]|uniref:uncharacterized protein n=1 Tax=Fomitopsis serialis TaxID=139415 RepID=UPI0020089C7A|nr:uncharacterized protein B0H18DRAFT_999464 [Neoantrodia serialis]KAH9928935.1 hypothetical protein B0H18DRAFT_999464 [Neoantrodia serialis]